MAFFFLFFFWVSSWCLVHMGSASFAGLPVVYKVWVTSVCLLLDTPFGRRSVEALPLTSGETAWQLIKTAYKCFWGSG